MSPSRSHQRTERGSFYLEVYTDTKAHMPKAETKYRPLHPMKLPLPALYDAEKALC